MPHILACWQKAVQIIREPDYECQALSGINRWQA